MSPEQAGGEPVDGRADLYALGCIVFEMLSGAPPFGDATPMALISAHMARTPPVLNDVVPSTPAKISRAVERALAKDPADRVQTASEFATLLVGDELEPPTGATTADRGRRRTLGTVRGPYRTYVPFAALALAVVGVQVGREGVFDRAYRPPLSGYPGAPPRGVHCKLGAHRDGALPIRCTWMLDANDPPRVITWARPVLGLESIV